MGVDVPTPWLLELEWGGRLLLSGKVFAVYFPITLSNHV